MFIKKIVFLMCLSLYSFVAFAGQQSAVSHGVNVRGANNNPLTETVCAKKYYSCMDAFCMLDNKPGGRCLCNDSYSDYDSVALEIEALDKQSYLLATTGVEIIESGQDVADMMEKNTTAKVDLSLWDSVVDDGLSGSMSLSPTSELDGLVGEKLRRTVSDLCLQQIPECESELRLLPSFYSNSIKSDCLGYENALKQQKTASQQKMDSAERALRSAALAQLKIENKYDLGQCITAFKDCMINTAGCGDDFSKCTDITMAADNATNAIFSIKGNISNIDIFKSTYDRLSAKKIMCDNVLKSCSLVSDMVWDGFLAEAAPQIKKAELIAQDNIRQDCVGNISKCFQTACKDNIDPNKPDESYDMCLTRPQSVLSFCKVELNACGVDAGSSETAEKSEIWDFVLARLASMRVDSCTASVKNCLQSEGRCGKDFTQCVGLDTNTIMHMCPYDKLTECTKQYGETNIRGDDVYDELAFMVQGIMLNIDNNMLEYCQNAVDSAMIKVCGDANNCDKMAIADDVGAGSLDYNLCEFGIKDNELVPNYANCRTDMIFITDKELGRISGSKDGLLGPITPFMPIIGGTIYWESVGANESGKIPSVDEYLAMLSTTGITDTQKQRVENELLQVQNGINIAIDAVEQDPIVSYCITGRQVDGVTYNTTFGDVVKDAARFPELTKSIRQKIVVSALKKAKDNYYSRFDALQEKMMQDNVALAGRMADVAGENVLDARREVARISCIELPKTSTLPKRETPPSNIWGTIIIAAVVIAATVVTAGAFGAAAGAAATATAVASAATSTGSAMLGLASIGAGAAAGAAATAATTTAIIAGTAAVGAGMAAAYQATDSLWDADRSMAENIFGENTVVSWNFQETVKTEFDWQSLVCHKTRIVTKCKKESFPLFGIPKCKTWEESETTESDIRF